MPNAAIPSGSVVSDACPRRSGTRRRRSCGAAITAAVAAATFLWPKSYRSEGKLLVRLGRENATLDATATLGQESVVAVPVSRDSEINSVVEILQSRSLLEKVVDAVGVGQLLKGASPADRERAVRLLTDGVRVAAVHRSNVVQVVFEGRSPELCRSVVGSLLTIYVAEHARLNRPQGSHDFFAEQADRLQGDVLAKEAAPRSEGRYGAALARRPAAGSCDPVGSHGRRSAPVGRSHGGFGSEDSETAAAVVKPARRRRGREDDGRRQRRDGPHAASGCTCCN